MPQLFSFRSHTLDSAQLTLIHALSTLLSAASALADTLTFSVTVAKLWANLKSQFISRRGDFGKKNLGIFWPNYKTKHFLAENSQMCFFSNLLTPVIIVIECKITVNLLKRLLFKADSTYNEIPRAHCHRAVYILDLWHFMLPLQVLTFYWDWMWPTQNFE